MSKKEGTFQGLLNRWCCPVCGSGVRHYGILFSSFTYIVCEQAHWFSMAKDAFRGQEGLLDELEENIRG